MQCRALASYWMCQCLHLDHVQQSNGIEFWYTQIMTTIYFMNLNSDRGEVRIYMGVG